MPRADPVEVDPSQTNVFVRYFTDYKFRWAIMQRHPIVGRLIVFAVIQAPAFVLLWLVGASQEAILAVLGVCIAADLAALLYYFRVERQPGRSTSDSD